jgi:hypothetical protein
VALLGLRLVIWEELQVPTKIETHNLFADEGLPRRPSSVCAPLVVAAHVDHFHDAFSSHPTHAGNFEGERRISQFWVWEGVLQMWQHRGLVLEVPMLFPELV